MDDRTLSASDRTAQSIWLLATALSIAFVCAPPIEFGLLYFVLHEAPLFVIWALFGSRRAVLSSVAVVFSAFVAWGIDSPVDWTATVLITPLLIVAMSLLRRLFTRTGVAWLAISAWLFIGSPFVFAYLFFVTGGNWIAAFTSLSYLLVSGATSGVLATIVLAVIRARFVASDVLHDTGELPDTVSLPELLESILVVVAYVPLVLLVYYSSQSYLEQTYSQIESIAESRFELVASGVDPRTVSIMSLPVGSQDDLVAFIQSQGRVIESADNQVHWVPSEKDIFAKRRYKKLSEYGRGVVTVLDTRSEKRSSEQLASATTSYAFETSFWQYFEQRFRYLAGWYAGIVVALWLSALFIRVVLNWYLIPLRELSETLKIFRVGGDVISTSSAGLNTWPSSSEVVDLSEGVRRLQAQVNQDLEEIEAMNETVVAASRAKSQFLASMSHDMRTPLTAIMGFAELLSTGKGSTEDRQDWHDSIVKNSRYMYEMVGNVLDMAAIESGQLKIKPEAIELRSWTEETVSLIKSRADAKRLDTYWVVGDDVPDGVMLDSAKLREILINLLSNAVKYTPEGSVRLEVSKRTFDLEAQLVFQVIDSGIGMSSDAKKIMFDPFVRVHDTEAMPGIEGNGLGLTIVRSFASAMGGDISVDSEPGMGTEIAVAIPLVRASPTSDSTEGSVANEEEVNPLLGYRLLVCEDSDTVLTLLDFVLKQAGALVTTAENGLVGRDLFKAAQDGSEPFDAVITDMQMPLMTGYELAAAIRPLTEIPIIALTAFTQEEDEKKCLEAGCSAYLTKPIDTNQFAGQIASIILDYRASEPEPNLG
ncbi:MAG: ATP-binding protein [Luminiphilus sp.]